MSEEPEFTGRYGREFSQQKGKTFYKGRHKQIRRGRNPEQWASYSKAPRMARSVRHFDPLSDQLSETRTGGVLSLKTASTTKEEEEERLTDADLVVGDDILDPRSTRRLLDLSRQQLDDVQRSSILHSSL